MEVYEPCTLAVLRLAIALAVFLPIVLLRGKRPAISKDAVILGLTGVTLFQILQNSGMESVSAGGSVIVLYGGVVVASTLLGHCVLGESCSKRTLGALALSAVGVAIVARDIRDAGSRGMPMAGVGLILAAAAAFAVYTVAGRRANRGDLGSLNAGMLIVGLIAILPFAAREQRPSFHAAMATGDLVALLILGAAVTAGSYFFWGYGIRYLPVAEASVLSSSEPVFGLLFAWMLLRESVSLWEALGAAVIIGSCVLIALVSERFGPGLAPIDAPDAGTETWRVDSRIHLGNE
jgi:drug/metabolite transporter, DME family